MTIKQKSIFSLLLVSFLFLFAVTTVLAQTPLLDSGAAEDLNKQDTAFLGQAGLTSFSLGTTVAHIIQALLSLLGVIFIILVIYAGFLWMTSAGNEENISKAKKIMTAAVIGLVIVLSAYAITTFVINRILIGTGMEGGSSSTPGTPLP